MITNNRYTDMQKRYYEPQTRVWSPDDREHIVGSFDGHNAWEDYKYLFDNVPNCKSRVCLDFGCGPARNLVKYKDALARIDGVDMLSGTLDAARKWISHNNLPLDNFSLHLCNGYNLDIIQDNSYDIVMSTICMQHICVHEIRYNYFKEFFRILKPNGYIAIQMGYGSPSPNTVDYYANYYEANTTNRGCDTEIKDSSQLKSDLDSIGFMDFSFTLGPPGPGDNHPNWIYFNARKL